jgi:protease II
MILAVRLVLLCSNLHYFIFNFSINQAYQFFNFNVHNFLVQYWEPAKFAAELRHHHDKESSGPVCLKMDMTAGHFSASDRYKYLSELAFDYAFLLDQLGLSKM